MLTLLFLSAMIASTASAPSEKIDRKALVGRHNVVLTEFDGERPLQVGNGQFAFGMDTTGLQTFAPFNTMSHWGWHSSPLPHGVDIEDFEGQVWDTHGRPVRYPMPDPKRPELSQWLAANPHRINLGRVGLVLTKADGTPAQPDDLKNPRQTLDLWTGIVTSRFSMEGIPVTVRTAAHSKSDTVAFQIESPLARQGRLAVFLSCPGNNPLYNANFVGDWSNPGRFEILDSGKKNQTLLVRHMDETTYHVGLRWDGEARFQGPTEPSIDLEIQKAVYGAGDKWSDVTEIVSKAIQKNRLSIRVGANMGPDPNVGVPKVLRVTYRAGRATRTAEAKENADLFIDADPGRSQYTLVPSGPKFSVAVTFSPDRPSAPMRTADETMEASRTGWADYWSNGGALDLSGSRDPRWKELERRVVLSQYLMAVNEAGAYPPAESGLVNNSWYGRFHMEMLWWHAAHWALWDRWGKAEPSLGVYSKFLTGSKTLAESQGYKGARWPKCAGPDGREWPNDIHALLIWQQPHPIFFAELDYRLHPTQKTLRKWLPIVDATADFMASYAHPNPETGRFDLGPPLYVVSENVPPTKARNPAFELGYWRFGLRVAQGWRQRLGMESPPEWEKVRRSLSPLPTENGVYVLHEGIADMWTQFNFEHPALTGTLGMLPGDGVDDKTMRDTLAKVVQTWNFSRTWGWDFPMLAMCAARLGDPEKAVDFLLHPSSGFQFDDRGLATGGPFPYFPSNGGLLYAVALMAAGWDGAPDRHAPGFPADGWQVRFEGLKRAP